MSHLRIATIVLTLFFSFSGVSQQLASTSNTSSTTPKEEKKSKEFKQAMDAFKSNEFYFAAEQFKKAFSKTRNKSERTEITFYLGLCNFKMLNFKNAINYFQRAINAGYSDPEVRLLLAQSLHNLGEWEDAIKEYEAYLNLQPDDQRAKNGIKGCRLAADLKKNRTRYLVENVKDLNTKENEFGVVYSGRPGTYDEIMFTSDRLGSTGKKREGWFGGNFTDIFIARAERKTNKRQQRLKRGENKSLMAETKWLEPVPVSSMINTNFHEGGLTLDKRRKTMYFTRCLKQKSQNLGCGIYVTERLGQDWKEPEIVILAPDSVSSVGHPALSPDDKFLYFASDMPGSLGGKDIWITTYNRRSRSWDTPKNLGPLVNGPGDELFPFAHDDGYLYFSSTSHPGLGGLDIFRVPVDEEGMPTGAPENMGYPINTNFDDFAIVLEDGGARRGFISSNREGGRGGDDLYAIYLAPLEYRLEVFVTNSKDKKPLQQVSARIDGSDGSSITVNTDKNGVLIVEPGTLKENVSYQINFEKKKFLSGSSNFTTMGITMDQYEFIPAENYFLYSFKINKSLDPIEEPIVLPNVFFDLAKWDLRPESKEALDVVYDILVKNPNIAIELRSHTDYRDSDANNDLLSQRRAQACVDYLIEKGIDPERLTAVGKGEREPFVVPENYEGYGKGQFKPGTVLTEKFIKTLSPELQEVANQINRRTDFRVISENYVPKAKTDQPDAQQGATATSTDSKPDAPTEKPIGQIHICEPRDNFGKIAQQYNITLRELRELNGGLRGVRVFEGLELKVTPGGDYTEYDSKRYRVEQGDNFRTIAQKTGLTVKELKQLNPNVKEPDLIPGLIIFVK
ncbi:MAG: OmpA family protein [Thermaurantimonas sp.]